MHRRTSYLLLSVWLTGCGETVTEWPVAYDLVAGLGIADTWSETRAFDFATPRGRRHLVSGWSEDRWDRQRQRGFVSNRANEAILRFDVLEPRPCALRFLAGPEESVDAPTEIDVSVNGNPVGRIVLEGRPRRHRLPIPEGHLRVGANELRLRTAEAADAAGQGNWYELELQFNDAPEPPLPSAVGESNALMLPYGTVVEYTVRLPVDSLLTIDKLRFVGQAGGELAVMLEEDGREASRLPALTENGDNLSLPLPTGRARIARLSLRAESPSGGISARYGVLLEAPAIRAPRADDPASISADRPLAEPLTHPRSRPNILLYVVDTLRADHLGVYGYDRPVSPALDRFADEATVFENAVAQSSWTRAAMASIFTGMWPLKHAANGRKDVLDANATTLAEILTEAGYFTAAKVRNWNVFPVFGFRQGFEDFHKVREGKADRVNHLVEAWLRSRPNDRSFFLWIHTVDPHEPYRPAEEVLQGFLEEGQRRYDLDKHPSFKLTREMSAEERQEVVRYLLALYDAEIASNDRAFGELVELMEELELLDSTVVIFVSDHGEEFLDHGTWGHGRNLYAENLNVPLIIRFPDRGHGVRVDQVVQQIDLLPTLLDYLGLPIPEQVEGRSLLPLVSPESAAHSGEPPPAYSFLHLDGAVYRSLVDEHWKLVQRLSDSGEVAQSALFDRRSDPTEVQDRILDLPIRGRYMELLLEAKMAEGSVLTTEEAELDEETENALKALGYLQ